MSLAKFSGNSDHGSSQWQRFSSVANEAIKRRREDARQTQELYAGQRKSEPRVERDQDVTTFENDLDSSDDSPGGVKRKRSAETEPGRRVKVSYEEKSSKDYVPALQVVGRLSCMEAWRKAEHRWLSRDVVEEVCGLDVLLVARYASVNPSNKDFCLSFTRAERRLAQCLTPTQRTIVLVMKAYLKGIYTARNAATGNSGELKLKTFHIKTIVYRVLDETDPAFWTEANFVPGVVKVLRYLETALQRRELLHYFVASNLFAGLEEEDFSSLMTCTREIIESPVDSLQLFFDIDDGRRVESWIMEEEVLCLEKMTEDGGLRGEVDRLEEALIDLQRGFNEAPRDEQGNSPLNSAMDALQQQFLEGEGDRLLDEAVQKHDLPPGVAEGLRPLVPQLSSVLGGVLANAQGNDLADTLGRFMAGSSRDRRLENELKHKAFSYFLGKR